MSTASSVVTHPLRRLLLVSFLVALPVNIVSAIILHRPLPAVGLVPLGLSTIVSGFLFGLSRLQSSEASNDKHGRLAAYIVFSNDVLAITGLLVVLILTWKQHSCSAWYYCRNTEDKTFLVAYATTPMLASLFIHTYLAVSMLYHGLGVHARIARLFASKPTECPHCHENIQPSHAPYFSFARGLYEPIQVMEEDRFRDDEGEVTLLDPEGDSADTQQGSTSKNKEPETV